MMLWIVALLIAFVAWYVIAGRTWLLAKPWMAWLYKSRVGEWLERRFFMKSESVLWGRFLQALGYGLAALASLGGIDLTPLALVMPEKWAWTVHIMPLVISLAGHVQVQLRMETTKPIELVNLPDNLPGDVAQVVAKTEAANEKAIAVIDGAKQAGEV